MRPDGCPNWEWHLSEERKIEGEIYKIRLIKMMNIEDVELNLYLSSDVIIKPPPLLLNRLNYSGIYLF